MTLLQFMAENPWLTFFLAWIAGETIFKTAQALRGPGRAK